jgi:hypothetical protein
MKEQIRETGSKSNLYKIFMLQDGSATKHHQTNIFISLGMGSPHETSII